MLISVIIPTFNSRDTIARAVSSVLRQTYKDYEIIIVDDASDDGVWDYMTALYGDNQKFHLHRLELNSGAGTARKVALSLARGEYYAFLDADDEWLDTKLARQMDVVRDVNADIVHCSYNIKNSSGELVGVALAKKQLVIYDFFWRNQIAMSSSLVSAKLAGALEMPEIRTRQDYAYWWQLVLRNQPVTVGLIEPLMNYYITKNSLSSSMPKNVANNYFMFRHALDYGVPVSCLLVLLKRHVTCL